VSEENDALRQSNQNPDDRADPEAPPGDRGAEPSSSATRQQLFRELSARDNALRELRARLGAKDQEVNALWSEVLALKAQLAAITDSRTFWLANLLKRMRLTLAPPATRRDIVLRLVIRTVRVVRREKFRGVGLRVLRKLAAMHRRQPEPRIGPSLMASGSIASVYYPNLVSVVLPVYNQANLLAAAIESVLEQDYPLFELIVVNDGSTDNIATVLQNYYRHPRVRILTQVNQKLPMALNSGFEFANGEFWTWTSADNLMERSHLSRLVDHLRCHPEADMVYANYLVIDDRGQPLADTSWRPHNRRPPHSPEIRLPHSTELLNTVKDNFIGPCFLYRNPTGRVVGEYDPQLLGVEDYDYWMRVNRLFTIQHLTSDEFLYRYRVHDNTLSARATELGIFARADGLMGHDSDRGAFYQAPWLICADGVVTARLAPLDCRPHRVRPWQPGQSIFDRPTKRLLIASPPTLANLSAAEAATFDAVLAWIEGPPSVAYEGGMRLGERAGLCLAANQALAARTALLHDRVVVMADAAEGLRLGLAFANCRTFYDRTRQDGQPARLPADAYRPADRPLRVLVQLDRFGQGGLEQIVLDLMSGLRKAGVRVVLLVVQEAALPPTVMRLADRVARLEGNDPDAAYRALLLEEEIDLVSSHYSLFGAAVAHRLSVPFVQTVQNTYVWLSPAQIEEHHRADPFTTAYVCVAPEVARYSDLKLGLSVDKMLVLANGVAEDQFRPAARPETRARLRAEFGIPPAAFVFLNVASIYPPKAQRFAVRALRQARDAGHDAWLVFLGGIFDFAYHDTLVAEVERLHLVDRVVFAGRRHDVAAFHGAADAFLLPSFWEGSSLALAEAVLAGLPTVISRVGSADEFAEIEGVKRVDPPFGSILDLDHQSLEQLLCADHPDYVERLAHAMIEVCLQPVGPMLEPVQRRALDRETMVGSYYRLFAWLAQGGLPAACRGWLRRAALLETLAVAEESPEHAAA